MSVNRPERRPIDPRSPRFVAAITAVVLAAALVLGPHSGWAGILLAIQTLAFAAGAVLGLQAQPYGLFYRRVIRPRLSPPRELEDPDPPRFAQAVGLGFALIAEAGVLMGIPAMFYIAVGFAFGAAFLNAVFGFCLGCEVYLLIRRHTGFGRDLHRSEQKLPRPEESPLFSSELDLN